MDGFTDPALFLANIGVPDYVPTFNTTTTTTTTEEAATSEEGQKKPWQKRKAPWQPKRPKAMATEASVRPLQTCDWSPEPAAKIVMIDRPPCLLAPQTTYTVYLCAKCLEVARNTPIR